MRHVARKTGDYRVLVYNTQLDFWAEKFGKMVLHLYN